MSRPDILYRPRTEDQGYVCCKAYIGCLTRASFDVRIVRGSRVEVRPYCTAHKDKLAKKDHVKAGDWMMLPTRQAFLREVRKIIREEMSRPACSVRRGTRRDVVTRYGMPRYEKL